MINRKRKENTENQPAVALGDWLTDGSRWATFDSLWEMEYGGVFGVFAYVVNEAEGWADYWHKDSVIGWASAADGCPCDQTVAAEFAALVGMEVDYGGFVAQVGDVYAPAQRLKVLYNIGLSVRYEWVEIGALNEYAPAETASA